MSGYFSRSLYDECNNKESIGISTKPGQWVFDTLQEHQEGCFSKNGPRNTRGMATSQVGIRYTDTIDIENSLRGSDIPLSRCMGLNTLQERDEKLNKLYTAIPKQEIIACSNNMDYLYTRLEPRLNVVEQSFNRYGFPIIDPLEFVYNGFEQYGMDKNNREGVSTRFNAKSKLEESNKKLREQSRRFSDIKPANS